MKLLNLSFLSATRTSIAYVNYTSEFVNVNVKMLEMGIAPDGH